MTDKELYKFRGDEISMIFSGSNDFTESYDDHW